MQGRPASLQVIFSMNPADMSIKIWGAYSRWLMLSLMAVCCACLLSGCLTSSSEDDYVSNVLAEAMQEYPPEVVVAGSALAPAPQPIVVSAPAGETVPAPVTAPVSIPSSVTVSVPQQTTVAASPVQTVSVTVSKPQEVPQAVIAPVAATPVQAVTAPEPVVEAAPSSTRVVPVVAAVPVTEGSKPVTSPVAPVPVARQVMPPPAVPTIQPDSVLWVSVSEDPSLNGRYIVNDASAIDFGYVGLVFLQDMGVEVAETELKRVLEGRYLKNATVSVKLAKASYDKIGVQGAVEMPSDIKIGPGATISLSEALRRAGGLRGNRENSRVKIVRGGLKTPFGPAAEGEVYSLVTGDGTLKVPDIFLRNDDLAYVFTPSMETSKGPGQMTGAGGKRVVLLGEVPRRGVVEFSENEPCTLMYLLFKVGGLPRFAKADKITVVRRNKDGSEQKFQIDGEKLMNSGKPEDDLVLETGDRIVVPARKISFF